jgi:hypothetical protein
MAMISASHHKRLKCDAQKYGKTANEKKPRHMPGFLY